MHLWDFKRAGIQIWDFWKPKMSDTGEHNESYLIPNSVLARFLESFTCLLRKWKWPLKLHYKRSLGSWAAQLCSGVRGDSTYHEDLAMDRLLVSMFVLLVISISVWTNHLYLFVQNLVAKYMVSRQVLPFDCFHLGPRGAGSTRAHWQPSKYAEHCSASRSSLDLVGRCNGRR